jgi:integrase/recombinase XerD
MKNLPLNNASFRYLEQSFKEWLDIQGYATSTVYNLPLHVRELLSYLEQQEINTIQQLKTIHIETHYQNLKERSNQRRGGGLSNGHLNKHIQALRKFTEYLRKVGRLEIPNPTLNNEQAERKIIFLTEEEIYLLFKASQTSDYHTKRSTLPDMKGGIRYGKPNIPEAINEGLQSRDRAMLAIFYGCGLRRNEGVNVNVGDINFDRSILHVRKGKNYKERFVPISKTNLKYLQEYIYDYRPELLHGSTSDALLISSRHGQQMHGQSILIRLKQLQYKTDNPDLQDKEIGLHTLRHSIATHLLKAGMKLDNISRFLGHSSLDSTQIYTHLTGTPTERKQPFNNIPHYEPTQLSEDER